MKNPCGASAKQIKVRAEVVGGYWYGYAVIRKGYTEARNTVGFRAASRRDALCGAVKSVNAIFVS